MHAPAHRSLLQSAAPTATQTLRVLFIDDKPENIAALQKFVAEFNEGGRRQIDAHYADSVDRAQALMEVHRGHLDAIVTDYDLKSDNAIHVIIGADSEHLAHCGVKPCNVLINSRLARSAFVHKTAGIYRVPMQAKGDETGVREVTEKNSVADLTAFIEQCFGPRERPARGPSSRTRGGDGKLEDAA